MSKPCQRCKGSGTEDSVEDYLPCLECEGTGTLRGELDATGRLVLLVSGGVLTDVFCTRDLERVQVQLIDTDDKDADGWSADQIETFMVKCTKGLTVIY